MASSAEDIIETAALGRPFTLGMLYDCRRDFLVPGVTLWDNEDLRQNTCQKRQQNTEFNITASDSIDEKSNSLNVSGSLKLSLLGGLVNVSGSAKYFQDTKKSHKQQRLTLHYKTTTRYESLTMSHLGRGKVSHPNVFEDRTATHVVTAILYGASAYFMFDRESSNDEDKKHVEGEAKLMMDKLKFIKISAEASFDLDEREKSAVEKFSCTFHGDFHLASNPSSFIEAMNVYRELPKLLGENGEHAVPVRVWMYPLVKLDSTAAKLQREISNSLITYTSRDIEHLNNTEMRCNDLLKNTAAKTFPVMEEKLRTFMQNCHHYKLEFVQNLGSVLPSIRGGGQEESALANILKAHEKSPFNSKNLDQWLTLKEKESDTIASILKQLEKLGAKLDDDLDDLLSDLDITNVVSFTFTSIDQPDSSLMKQLHFLTPAGMMSECPDTRQTRNTTRKRTFDARDTMKPSHPMNEEWLSAHTKQIMRRQLQLFKHLKEQLDSSDNTKFIVASKYDERFPGACIFIYEGGNNEPVPFIPPSKPATPTTSDVSCDKFTVGVSDPDSATVEHQVEVRRKQLKQEGEWTSHSVMKNQQKTTLSGLKPDTEYEIRVTAVGKLGFAVSSDVSSGLTDISPPTNMDMKKVKANSITLTWRNPPEQHYQSLCVEYRMKQETEWKSHAVQENQEEATLTGLKPDTEYEIRVTAVGKQGCSVSSDVVSSSTDISPPTNLELSENKAHSIILTWKNPPDQQYQSLRVDYSTKPETKWKSHSVQKKQQTATLQGLKPDTEYEIRVTALGKLNCAVSSDIVSGLTDISPPTNLEVNDMKRDSITLNWRNAPDEEYQSLSIEYRMDAKWTHHSVQKNQETVTLSGLKPDTEYEIRATAVGKLGCSVSSGAVTARTKALSPPSNLEDKEVRADSITLIWKNPSDQECTFLFTEYKMEIETEWTYRPVKGNQETVTLSGLRPDTKYKIRVTAADKLGYVSSDVLTAVTKALSPPTNVKVTREANSFTITWSNPEHYEDLKQYIIEYKDGNSSDWQKEETKTEVNTFTLRNLRPNTTYSIRMRTEAGSGVSEPGREILTKTKKGQMDEKRFTPLAGTPPVYLLNMKRTGSQINKMIFGEESSINPSNKTIMLVGATGSGKTILINGMINYMLGVDWEDNWRFKLIDETNKSQTSEVTAYQIHHTDEFQIPYSLTIIDTPGFGDTRGIKQDKEITEKIRQFFTNKNGIDSIDAVCFVVQAALARLKHTQRYIFEAILSVFGKNIADNIITLVTFADVKSPPVLEAIKEANIPCATEKDGTPVHFKFNNSVLFADNTRGIGDEGVFDFMFWKMGMASMRKFFTQLDTMQTQSLTLTKQVLQERKQLEDIVEGVQPLIRKGLSTMEETRAAQAVLENCKSQIEANKDFEYEVEVEKSYRIDIPRGTFVTNCHKCNYTCHYPCYIPNDGDLRQCPAMRNGYCTVCPGKCVWSAHFNMTYRWEFKRVKEERTYQELKSKFERAMGEKMNTEKSLKSLQVKYDGVKEEVGRMMNTVSKCLTRLEEIALQPDPLSTPDYIDLLIESEKVEARPGWQQRIQELQEVRQSAVLMQKVTQGMGLSGVLPDNGEEKSVVHRPPSEVSKRLLKWFK